MKTLIDCAEAVDIHLLHFSSCFILTVHCKTALKNTSVKWKDS